MNRFFDALGRNVVRLRYFVVLVWIILLVIASRTLPSLGSEVNNDNSQFLPSTAPSSQAATLATPIFGNPNTTSDITVVAATAHGRLNSADQSAIVREADLLRKVPRVESVRVAGISSDGDAAQLLARVPRQSGGHHPPEDNRHERDLDLPSGARPFASSIRCVGLDRDQRRQSGEFEQNRRSHPIVHLHLHYRSAPRRLPFGVGADHHTAPTGVRTVALRPVHRRARRRTV